MRCSSHRQKAGSLVLESLSQDLSLATTAARHLQKGSDPEPHLGCKGGTLQTRCTPDKDAGKELINVKPPSRVEGESHPLRWKPRLHCILKEEIATQYVYKAPDNPNAYLKASPEVLYTVAILAPAVTSDKIIYSTLWTSGNTASRSGCVSRKWKSLQGYHMSGHCCSRVNKDFMLNRPCTRPRH